MKKLFAVLLGGRAKGCNTELHDVVFVAGESIEATHLDLLRQWFGARGQAHIDAWVELTHVDGHAVRLSPEPATGEKKLFFVNLGAYVPGRFSEEHENVFVVARDAAEAKSRAKREFMRGMTQVHKDTIHDVDDCLEIAGAGGLSVHLTPEAPRAAKVVCDYVPFPREVVERFLSE